MTTRGVIWLRTGVVPVILCLWLATPCTRAQGPNEPAAAGKPLSKSEIIYMLGGQVTPTRVATLARERGIDFEITAEVEVELRKFGADDSLLATLRESAPKPSRAPEPVPGLDEHTQTWVSVPGTASYFTGDSDNTISGLRQALQLKPQDANLHNGLGVALNDKGDHDGAISEFREAIRAVAANAWPHLNLGWAFEHLKSDRRAALEEYRQVHERYPKNDIARENYERLVRELGVSPSTPRD